MPFHSWVRCILSSVLIPSTATDHRHLFICLVFLFFLNRTCSCRKAVKIINAFNRLTVCVYDNHERPLWASECKLREKDAASHHVFHRCGMLCLIILRSFDFVEWFGAVMTSNWCTIRLSCNIFGDPKLFVMKAKLSYWDSVQIHMIYLHVNEEVFISCCCCTVRKLYSHRNIYR